MHPRGIALLFLGLILSGGAQATCLSLGVVTQGRISTESSDLRNSCATAVAYTYCVDSPNGGGVFSCNKQKFGSGSAGPGRSSGISVMGSDSPVRVHWYECQADAKNSHPMVVKGRFVNGRVEASCR